VQYIENVIESFCQCVDLCLSDMSMYCVVIVASCYLWWLMDEYAHLSLIFSASVC